MKIVKVKKVKTPTRGTKGSAGLDFFIPKDFETVLLRPQGSILIKSGIHVKIPKGYALIGMNKSGVAVKKGLVLGACVIDEDYEGEILFHLINSSDSFTEIKANEKIVQTLLIAVKYEGIEVIDSLEELYKGSDSERKEGRMGSTN